MTLFLVAVPHPLSCRSYSRTVSLLEDTLRSVCAQLNPDFHVIVICNERPPVGFDHPSVEYLLVDFEPVPSARVAGIRIDAGSGFQIRFSDRHIRTDKGCRFFMAIQHARGLRPSHVMFVDNDDFVSNRISDFVQGHRVEHGWFLRDGYLYSSGSSRMAAMPNFNRKCGSGEILPFEPLLWREELPTDATKSDILARVDNYYIKRILGGHRRAPFYFARRGRPLRALPFPGAVWHVNHGANYSGQRPYGRRDTVSLSDELRAEFSIPDHVPVFRAAPVQPSHQ